MLEVLPSPVNFARERVTYTKSFERYVLELSAFMTIQDVAHHLQVSWDLVKGIQKRYLKKKFSRPRLRHVRQIAIDEIHIGRSGFATVVLDLCQWAPKGYQRWALERIPVGQERQGWFLWAVCNPQTPRGTSSCRTDWLWIKYWQSTV